MQNSLRASSSSSSSASSSSIPYWILDDIQQNERWLRSSAPSPESVCPPISAKRSTPTPQPQPQRQPPAPAPPPPPAPAPARESSLGTSSSRSANEIEVIEIPDTPPSDPVEDIMEQDSALVPAPATNTSTNNNASTPPPEPHSTFKQITIHTAKCDVCNLHNKSTLRRCTDCGWQICSPCWSARGGNGTHGATRKFTGPVYQSDDDDEEEEVGEDEDEREIEDKTKEDKEAKRIKHIPNPPARRHVLVAKERKVRGEKPPRKRHLVSIAMRSGGETEKNGKNGTEDRHGNMGRDEVREEDSKDTAVTATYGMRNPLFDLLEAAEKEFGNHAVQSKGRGAVAKESNLFVPMDVDGGHPAQRTSRKRRRSSSLSTVDEEDEDNDEAYADDEGENDEDDENQDGETEDDDSEYNSEEEESDSPPPWPKKPSFALWDPVAEDLRGRSHSRKWKKRKTRGRSIRRR
ncbi:hypothetical protein AJ80_04839 [Polytolypa hystricis UAMH7299]|uniref:Uncharacterized protein n=1 Tax=Polytolypa hystricis (strain UAMH7299) TaxID=1447883 RepID=A0A2B7Y8M7_POLH7|nr:hypothetical protein AJ80_04839 [Polytolypa hystricis UAMH7299]